MSVRKTSQLPALARGCGRPQCHALSITEDTMEAAASRLQWNQATPSRTYEQAPAYYTCMRP